MALGCGPSALGWGGESPAAGGTCPLPGASFYRPREEGAVERLQRVWMRWPRACFLTLLGVATAIALVDRATVGADTRPMLAGVALAALWIHLWVGHLRVVLAGARSR